MLLTGTFTALVTPFQRSGEIDWPALEKLVKTQIEKGVDGLVPCGTTGESPTLSHQEHDEVIARVVEWAKKTNPDAVVIAGTGSNSTQEAVRLTLKAGEAGADYALLVNPYYNKPTQEGLYLHFKQIADESQIPLVLYNIPGRTSVKLSVDTIKRLSRHNNIAGVKEATGDLSFMTEILCEVKEDDFTLLSGDDNLLLPILSIGGKGIISVCSNVLPEQISKITRDYLNGNISQAQSDFLSIFPFCQAMFVETNPIPVKFALAVMGGCENVLRPPLTELSKAFREPIQKLLSK